MEGERGVRKWVRKEGQGRESGAGRDREGLGRGRVACCLVGRAVSGERNIINRRGGAQQRRRVKHAGRRGGGGDEASFALGISTANSMIY